MPWQPQNVGCKKRSYIACFIQNVLARLQDVMYYERQIFIRSYDAFDSYGNQLEMQAFTW